MIKLKPIGTNMTTLIIDSTEYFFSYETLVGLHNGKALITDKFYSKTTSRHLTKWLAEYGLNRESVKKISQSALEHYLDREIALTS